MAHSRRDTPKTNTARPSIKTALKTVISFSVNATETGETCKIAFKTMSPNRPPRPKDKVQSDPGTSVAACTDNTTANAGAKGARLRNRSAPRCRINRTAQTNSVATMAQIP